MRIVLLTDTHFGVRGDSHLFLDYQERFFKEVFFPYIDEHRIAQIIHLGDTFDRRKFINYHTLHKTKNMYFEEIRKRGLYSNVIIGNHDTFHKNSNKINSVELVIAEYQYREYLDPVVSDPQLICDETIALVPWICDENRDRVFDFLKHTKARICLGHFSINGFIMHYGHIEDKGIDKEIFDKFDLTLSGHFHYKSNQGNIHYLGAPYEMTWGDYGSQKGFHVLDTETLKLEFIPNPFKMFHRLNYVEGMIFPKSDIYKGTYVKVTVSNRKKSKKFDQFLEDLYDLNPFSITVIEQQIITEDDDIDVSEAEDPPKTINNYIDGSVLPYNIKVDKLKNLMYNTYQKTLEL